MYTYTLTSNEGVKMLYCVLYVFFNGASMIPTECVIGDNYVAVDKIEYVDQQIPSPPVNGFATYYSPPSIVWTTYQPQPVKLYSPRVKTYYPSTWRWRSYPRYRKKGVYRLPGVYPYRKKVKIKSYKHAPYKKHKKNLKKKKHK